MPTESTGKSTNRGAFALAGGAKGVLLLHGFTGTPWEVAWLGRRLNEAGYTVAGPLLPGHGTRPEDLQTKGPEDWYNAAQKALDDLAARCESVAVAGLSMGGALAIQLAVTRPDRVRAAVVMAMPYLLARQAAALLWLYKHTPAAKLWPLFPKLGADKSACDPRVAAENPAYQNLPMIAAQKLPDYFDTIRKLVPRMRKPTLVIQGERDLTVRPEGSRRLAKKLGSTQVWQLYLPRSAHLVTADLEKEQLADTVRGFLSQFL